MLIYMDKQRSFAEGSCARSLRALPSPPGEGIARDRTGKLAQSNGRYHEIRFNAVCPRNFTIHRGTA
jgi:hypothetical protein